MGYEVMIISRHESKIKWDDTQGIIYALENAALVINLAGKSINCRFTLKNKNAILESRMNTTKLIGEAMMACKHPPPLWINASTASVYGGNDSPRTEINKSDKNNFLADVARKWEEVFFSFQVPGTRLAALRFGQVLGKNGGSLPILVRLTKFGLGGRQGNGLQMVSWIHVEDLFRVATFLTGNEILSGIFNCTSPTPVNNQNFMRTLRNVVHVRFGLPAASWMISVGAYMSGTEPQLILDNVWVLPERLMKAGFSFQFRTLKEALEDILNKHTIR